MTPSAQSGSPKADPLSTQTSRSTLSRPTSRRSMNSSDGAAAHPLLASPPDAPDGASTGAASSYPIYSAGKKRSTGASGSASLSSTSPSPVPPSEGPLSPAASTSTPSSALSTPPFAPTSAPFLPPLISRPSNSTLPSPSGRHYARSVSEAKEQLQRQALKAELQSLGLATDSAGAALIHGFANALSDPVFKGLQELVAEGKATLLLPAEKLDSPGSLMPGLILDHVILLDPLSSTSGGHTIAFERGFATLSGLRGVLTGGELVFASCGGLVMEGETAEMDLTREETLRALRGVAPLPAPPPGTSYPSNMLFSAIANLSVPLARPATPLPVSPPPTSRTTSRLAALFAKQTPLPSDASDLPPVVAAPAGILSGDASPIGEGDSASSRKAASVTIPVLAVGKIVRRDEVAEAITRATAGHLRRKSKAIEGVEGDADVIGELSAFAVSLGPPAKTNSGPLGAAASTGGVPAPIGPTETLFAAEPSDVSDAYQDTMHSVRLNLTRNLGTPSAKSRTGETDASSPSPGDGGPGLEDFSQLEERVDSALEKLEDLVTSVLHDRLFAPSERVGAGALASRDLQEDENLASRIAALNVLELGLEHLGIDLGDENEELPGWEGRSSGARESLEDLATLVGKQLNRLEDPEERAPSAKLAILVECHKVLVDGLSKLPPVPLKKDLDDAEKASLSAAPAEVEMDDASSRSSSLPPSRALSPPLEADKSEDDLLKTPRAPQPHEERDVPAIKLPEASELSLSVLEATSSSLLEHTIAANTPSPPVSIFETKRRTATSGSASPTSSADLILPILIYSVVRANPPHLVSHLRYIHRFRSESLLHGQSSFCATNFNAVVEFLNHVDISSLGLSSHNLIPAGGGGGPSSASLASPASASSTSPASRPRAYTTPSLLRSRVSTTADQLVGSANTALTGVVSSSYYMLFGPKGLSAAAPRSLEDVKSVLEGARGRARESLPFRRSASSRAVDGDSPSSITRGSGARTSRAVTLALDGDKRTSPLAEATTAAAAAQTAAGKGEEMISFTPSSPSGTPSEPMTIAEAYAPPPPPRHPRTTLVDKDAEAAAAAATPPREKEDDARSIRSVSSFLNFRDSTLGRALGEVRDGVVGVAAGATGSASTGGSEERSSGFGGRLAGLPVLHRFGGSAAAAPGSSGPAATSNTSPVSSRRSSLLNPLNGVALSPWAASSSAAPPVASVAIPALGPTFQPNERFLDVASASDLKLGEVQLLLDEYKRLAKAVLDVRQETQQKKGEGTLEEVGEEETS